LCLIADIRFFQGVERVELNAACAEYEKKNGESAQRNRAVVESWYSHVYVSF